MSKFDRRMARKSEKNQKDLVCIPSNDFFNFLYSFSFDFQMFLVSKNPELAHFLKPLTPEEFLEFYVKGFE